VLRTNRPRLYSRALQPKAKGRKGNASKESEEEGSKEEGREEEGREEEVVGVTPRRPSPTGAWLFSTPACFFLAGPGRTRTKVCVIVRGADFFRCASRARYEDMVARR
jgi:hypothetical protein